MDYFTCSFGRKINFLKCGDNEGPVATFVATLVIGLDTAGLVIGFFSLSIFLGPKFMSRVRDTIG